MKNILITLMIFSSFNIFASDADDLQECQTMSVGSMDGHTLSGCKALLEKAGIPANSDRMLAINSSLSQSNQPAPPRGNSSSESGSCNDPKIKAEAEAAKTDLQYPGTTKFGTCDKLARGKLSSIYSSSGSRSDFKWGPYIKYACCGNSDKECESTKTKLAKSCESIAYLIGQYGRDWNDGEQTSPISGSGKASPAAGGNNGATVGSASTIKCTSAGIETVDYEACKKFQVQLDIIEAVQQVGYGAQELVYKDKMSDAQIKHATDENTATGALKATGESLKMQQDMYQQRTAVDATKLAYLYSIYSEMPKTDEAVAKCRNMNFAADSTLGSPVEEATCKSAAYSGGGFGLLMNQQQTEAMKSKLITIATAAGSSAILANLLGKRADDVNNAIAKIDAFKPIDPFVVSEDEAISTLCKQNPGLPQCLTGGLDRTFDTLNDNVITFGDPATGTSYGANAIVDSGITNSGNSASTAGPVDSVGTIIPSAIKDNTMERATAATVKTGGTGSTGGGGGGGGGMSGGGGGAPAAPGNPGGVAAAIQGKTPTYGGGEGSISVMGGFGINKKKADGKEENPFGKLFGKDAPKGSGVVNFRDLASVGNKGDNLFEMISKRYTSVNADKRLLEYELTK